MIAAGILLFVAFFFCMEGILWAAQQRRRVEVEVAYWARSRPELYDWEKDLPE